MEMGFTGEKWLKFRSEDMLWIILLTRFVSQAIQLASGFSVAG